MNVRSFIKFSLLYIATILKPPAHIFVLHHKVLQYPTHRCSAIHPPTPHPLHFYFIF
jgi:hypothetical protein